MIILRLFNYKDGNSDRERLGGAFTAQTVIRRCDLHAQIQKFWDICSNFNFKENYFYHFQSLFWQNNFWNVTFKSNYKSKIFYATNHGGVRD